MWFEQIPFENRLTNGPLPFHFSLHAPKVWIIESGRVDLFAVEKKGLSTEGTHHFLQEFQQGELLFGDFEPHTQFEIQATADAGSVIKVYDSAVFFKKISESKELITPFIPHYNKWVGSLPTPFLRFRKTKDAKVFFASQKEPFSLKKGERIFFEHLTGDEVERMIHWVRVEKGSLALLGWKEVTVNAPSFLPLRTVLWWKAMSESLLVSISLVNLIKEGKARGALLDFNRWFLPACACFSKEVEQHEKELIEKKTHLEEKLLKQSLGSLASVLTKEGVPEKEISKDALFLACQHIGGAMDITFHEPKGQTAAANTIQRLIEICEASQIRYSRVRLDGTWWKEIGDPYLSFYGKEKEPVALIRGKKSYEIVFPKTQERREVNEENAKEIAPYGFCFFAPFEEKTLTWKEILKFGFKGHGKKISYVFLMGLAITLLGLFLPIASKLIFGVAIPEQNVSLLWQIGAGIFLASLASFLYQLSQGFLIFHINTIAGNRIENASWDRILKLPVAFFKNFSVGDLWARISGLITIRRNFNNYYIHLFLAGLFSIVYLIAMAFFSLILTLVGFAVLFVLSTLCFLSLLFVMLYQKRSLSKKGALNGFIVQIIAGINKIRQSGAEARVFSRWAEMYASAKKTDLLSQDFNNAILTVFAVLPSLSYLCIFAVVIYFVATQKLHQISTGNFFGFVTAFGAFSQAVLGAVPALTAFYRSGKPLWERMQPIFKTAIEIDPRKAFAPPLEGQIVVDHVDFRYDPNGPLVLKNVSLKARPGEFLGIIGPSGSGKSTLIRLLLGFETPEKGSIYYDGSDLAHLDLGSVRRQMGTVLQTGSLLGGSLYENLVLGGIYSLSQIERAVKLSGFEDDLWNFPMGLYTVIPSGGGTLSSGQKQRLLIARALISNPKILLLDEATSSLDAPMQDKLSQNIEKLNVTRIVVAHRLSTIRQADRIYVFDRGEIVDSGTFEELAERPGLFAGYIAKQKL